MKIQSIKKAFTLIELLVVITIIGILATGAATVYTSQIQKARDSTRVTDVKAIQSAVEQVYQDSSEYPHSDQFLTGATVTVKTYLANIPGDDKHGQPCNDAGGAVDCGYAYVSGPDGNGIDYGSYEISVAFENSGNATSKAIQDAGTDNARLEVGIETDSLDSSVDAGDITNPDQNGACAVGGGAPGNGTTAIVINLDGDCS